MKFSAWLLVVGVMIVSGACQPAPQSTTNADGAARVENSAAPASFTVDALGDAEWSIQGCSTMLSRVGAPVNQGILFAEDAVDNGAKGFIKINGHVLNVSLASASGGESAPEVRTFADAAHTVEVVETTTLGEAHEEADSVERAGTLAVTFGGATQTIPVEGGTAC